MKHFKIAFLVICLSITCPSVAFAYIDPGSGSMILQLLLAGVAGIGMLFKFYWRRITALFRRSPAGAASEEDKE